MVLLSKCWTFYKPKTLVSMYFYKNTSGRFVNMVFNKKWAEANICNTFPSLTSFFNSKAGYLTWLNQDSGEQDLFDAIFGQFEHFPYKVNEIKKTILQLQYQFFLNTHQDNRLSNYISLATSDYSKAAKAERIILNNLHLPFIGITKIAHDLHMAPTKLKIIFKSVFGLSMLQYHKEKNLLLAQQLVKNTPIKINLIAMLAGYESASKFSSAFKKRFGVLPSAYRKMAD